MADKRATYIQPSLMQDIMKMVEHYRRLGVLGSGPRVTQAIDNQREIYVRNDDATAAPPFACMQVTDTVEVDGQNYLVVEKPADSDGTAGWYVFNGQNEIEANGGFGIAFDGPMCRMLTDGSTVTAGDVWGPVASQWTIAPSGSLFVIAGEDDIATDVVKGSFCSRDGFVCETPSGGITARSGSTISSAMCVVYKRVTNTISSTSNTVKVWNLSTTAVAGSVLIVAEPTNIGLVAVWEDC
jgi:hypothetical protein